MVFSVAMAKLSKIPRSPNWYIAWSDHGRSRIRSTGTRDRAAAEQMLKAFRVGEKFAFAKPVKEQQNILTVLNRLWARSKDNAVTRNIPFELTKKDIVELYRDCSGRCAVTGIPLDFGKRQKGERYPWIPSIDRIDSTKPYTKENARLVCAATNYAMNKWGEAVLWRIAFAMQHQWRKSPAPSERSAALMSAQSISSVSAPTPED